MSKLPLKPPLIAEFFTKVSYVKNEPIIEIVPVAMPNYERAIAIGEDSEGDGNLEGKITLTDNTGEFLGIRNFKQFGFETSWALSAAYQHLQNMHGAEFENFLTTATHAAKAKQWSQFPMSFPPKSWRSEPGPDPRSSSFPPSL